ncbi:ADP ribosylation factor 3, putative [Leishmania tarentolae]|uniref:ADP ribosylation factor 3, putative n=1 Tax=Leishmania tarentolae TaxID=5689 RepID=A0A640KMT0_LEITA|nr:ADP ribosylation factor 3, putative [Leishmania tarentolae]GET90365.1 ADP ribosylation factor 3, putative [Leishmania tarentolae]
MQALTGFRAALLDRPRAIAQAVQIECCAYIFRGQCSGEVALVGENKYRGLTELFFLQKGVKLRGSLLEAAPVGSIDNVNQAIHFIVVVWPVRADRLLATNIPHVQLKALTVDGFDVESLSRLGGGRVLVGQLAENGSFASIIEAQNQHAWLCFALFELSKECEKAHLVNCCKKKVWWNLEFWSNAFKKGR